MHFVQVVDINTRRESVLKCLIIYFGESVHHLIKEIQVRTLLSHPRTYLLVGLKKIRMSSKFSNFGKKKVPKSVTRALYSLHKVKYFTQLFVLLLIAAYSYVHVYALNTWLSILASFCMNCCSSVVLYGGNLHVAQLKCYGCPCCFKGCISDCRPKHK